jgi:hypothetical protein
MATTSIPRDRKILRRSNDKSSGSNSKCITFIRSNFNFNAAAAAVAFNTVRIATSATAGNLFVLPKGASTGFIFSSGSINEVQDLQCDIGTTG